MPGLDVQDAAADGKVGWLTRLAGAGARVRSALRGALRDPEIGAIRDAAKTLERDGAVVFASLGGWPRPPALLGFVPDVYAVFEDCEVALSFENEQSAAEAPTRRQDLAFTAWADASSQRVYEQIVVAGGRGERD
jgi:hypothetical protein